MSRSMTPVQEWRRSQRAALATATHPFQSRYAELPRDRAGRNRVAWSPHAGAVRRPEHVAARLPDRAAGVRSAGEAV